MESCDTVTLQWDQPSEPNHITTSVSCTPSSQGCAECTTSPCTITRLTPSTEYVFTVTLNSGGCRASMNTTTARTMGEIKCVMGAYMGSAWHCKIVVYRHFQSSSIGITVCKFMDIKLYHYIISGFLLLGTICYYYIV